MEFLFLSIISKKSLNITDNLFNKDKVLKTIGALTLLHQGIKFMGWDKKYVFYLLKKIPYIREKIHNKKLETRENIKNDLNHDLKGLDLNLSLPSKGKDKEEILNEINKYKQLIPFNAYEGKVSGCVYSNSGKIDDIMSSVFPLFERSNPLHPDIFPGVRKMEAEVVNMCANLMKSSHPEAGCFTSGGTESILLAMRCYKKIAKERGGKGTILLAKSAHAAYWKAAEYFDMDVIEIETNYLPLEEIHVENYLTKDTIVVITSAPSFNFGIVDNIQEISDFCFKHHIYLHVDMCLGGFLIPFLDNYNINFTQLGISSISMDTHKYGYGPKGGSVLLYNDPYLFKKHCFVKDNWSGGIYGTSNLTGSRSGAVIAMTWATMMACGVNTYEKEAKRISNMVIKLSEAVRNNPHIDVMGEPEVCVVGIGSSYFNIYLLADMLKEKGWSLNLLQNPPSFHFCITSIHTMSILNQLIEDMNNCTYELMKTPNLDKQESPSIYGTTQKINDREIIGDVVKEYIVCLNELQ